MISQLSLKIKSFIKKTFVFGLYCKFVNCHRNYKTKRLNRFKQHIVRQEGKKCGIKVFIETGTYLGDMVWAVRNNFKEIYSIELGLDLFIRAQKRFESYDNIKLLHGDSSEKLKEVLDKVVVPCLFWLDAHYSGGITAKGQISTPVLSELSHVFHHNIKNHVILIDDAHCFAGKDGYPTLDELSEFVRLNSSYHITVKDNIIKLLSTTD